MDLSDEPGDRLGTPEVARGHHVLDAIMTAREKEAQERRGERDALESGEENRCNPRPPEDRQLQELLELQRRMFESGCCE
jgi:hypothetical protein